MDGNRVTILTGLHYLLSSSSAIQYGEDIDPIGLFHTIEAAKAYVANLPETTGDWKSKDDCQIFTSRTGDDHIIDPIILIG